MLAAKCAILQARLKFARDGFPRRRSIDGRSPPVTVTKVAPESFKRQLPPAGQFTWANQQIYSDAQSPTCRSGRLAAAITAREASSYFRHAGYGLR